jgi:hypothetical protein
VYRRKRDLVRDRSVLILGTPCRQWSLPPRHRGERRWMRWRNSRCPSLGCSALGAELEWNGENSNDLSGIVLTLLGSNLPLIFRGRSGTWLFGRVEPVVYMRRSSGGSYSGVVWTMAMLWSKKKFWASSSYFVLTC